MLKLMRLGTCNGRNTYKNYWMLILSMKFTWMAVMIIYTYIIKELQVIYLVVFSITEVADIFFAI